MSIEDTEAIGNRFIAIFNEQNPANSDEIFAPNFSARLPGAPTLDREGWKAFLGIFPCRPFLGITKRNTGVCALVALAVSPMRPEK
jgi:hypothetical protein